MKIGELHARAREAVEVRCRVALGAKDADVTITHVVGEDDDDVGQAFGGRPGAGEEQEREQGGEGDAH